MLHTAETEKILLSIRRLYKAAEKLSGGKILPLPCQYTPLLYTAKSLPDWKTPSIERLYSPASSSEQAGTKMDSDTLSVGEANPPHDMESIHSSARTTPQPSKNLPSGSDSAMSTTSE